MNETNETDMNETNETEAKFMPNKMNETKVAVSKIADTIQEYLEYCDKKSLIELHNFIFDDQIDLEDVDFTK